ncbi:MAG: PDZ domain-containing protein, partial [Silvibacterium sp.]
MVLILAVCSFDHLAQAQKLSRSDRDLADTILGNVSTDVRKNYFDANLHGLDWEALVSQTKQAIADAPNMGMANAEIAALLEKLNDSHTRYFPPRSTLTVDYGWQFQMVGNRCFVTQVRPKSDAEAKGMKPGDEILTVEGFTVDRQSLPRLQYAMTILMPRSRLTVEIRDLSGKIQKLTIDASVKKNQVVSGLGDESWGLNEIKIREENAWKKGRAQYKELGPDLMILRIPEFIETDSDVDALIKKARNHKTLIVDLRGTPGGLVDS